MDINKDIGEVTIIVHTDRIHDSSLDITIINKVVVQSFMLYMTFNLPEDEDDKVYRREIFKTTVDPKKLMDGIYGSYLLKSLFPNFFASADFIPKFPFEKVEFLFSFKSSKF